MNFGINLDDLNTQDELNVQAEILLNSNPNIENNVSPLVQEYHQEELEDFVQEVDLEAFKVISSREDSTHVSYHVRNTGMKCSNCGWVTKKEACIRFSTMVDLPTSGTAHHFQKCKGCNETGALTMIPCDNGGPYTLKMAKSGEYANLVILEYIGCLEPIGISFGCGWKAQLVRGGVVDTINLANGSYYSTVGGVHIAVENIEVEVD